MFECSANNNVGTNYNICGNDNLIIFIGGCNVFAATKMVEVTPMFATAMMLALLWKTTIFDVATRWRSLAVKAIVSNGYAWRRLSTVVKAIGNSR